MYEVVSTGDLLEKAQILYEFVDRFSAYENTTRDYCDGIGDSFSMAEVHILAIVDDKPGINVTELSVQARRSKGFISQVISKFRKMDYIVCVAEQHDAKIKQLYVSAKGKKLCAAHSSFDEKQLLKTYNYLLRDCAPDEIAAFYKVMTVYNNIMRAAERKHKAAKESGQAE